MTDVKGSRADITGESSSRANPDDASDTFQEASSNIKNEPMNEAAQQILGLFKLKGKAASGSAQAELTAEEIEGLLKDVLRPSPALASNNPFLTTPPTLPPDDHTFPDPFPAAGPGDRFIGIHPPFEYDDDVRNWQPWKTEVLLYMDSQRKRFRSRTEVLYTIMASTKIGSRAKSQLRAIGQLVLGNNSRESTEFQACAGVRQATEWILAQLARHQNVLGLMAAQKNKLYTAQGSQRYDTWIQNLDTLRQDLGIPSDHLLNFVISNMSHDIRYEIAKWLGKHPEELTWEELTIEGPSISFMYWQRNKAHHGQWKDHGNTAPQPRTTTGQWAPRHNSAQQVGTTPKQPRLNDADFALVRQAGACFKCRETGHRSDACTNPRSMEDSLTEAKRDLFRRLATQRQQQRAQNKTGQTMPGSTSQSQ